MVTTTRRPGHSEQEMRRISASIRADALFASPLQPSESPSEDRVRAAVTGTLMRVGSRGCAALLAGEFGDHPNSAAARMAWARMAVRAAYRELDQP